jgi:cathepsin A (carboxypeptidase C)
VAVSVDDDVVDPSLCGDGTATSRAGYFDLTGSTDNDGSKNYYFWMFDSKHAVSTDPVVLWLTGGPGCSSVLALLSENGPCTVNPDGQGTTNNPYAWHQNATVIWLDQPAGVGFSYGEENDGNVDMVGEGAWLCARVALNCEAQLPLTVLLLLVWAFDCLLPLLPPPPLPQTPFSFCRRS